MKRTLPITGMSDNMNVLGIVTHDDLKRYEGKDRIDERVWYHNVCAPEEIDRIMNVQNASDYILKLRADTIIENSRLWRVFLNLSKRYGDGWSLSKYFTAYSYADVKNCMPPEYREICERVTYGSIICSNPNGLIFDTEYGICSTYSLSLKYFTQYALLTLLNFGKKVPDKVCVQAMRIALRVMLQKEALDFELDPRGIIPKEISKEINWIFPLQTSFIAGHEYSHLINGDLNHNNSNQTSVLKARFKDETDYKMINSYNIEQQHEFKADLGALSYPIMDDKSYSYLYYATMLWFASLAIFEAAENTIFPPYGFQTHPGAKARYNNILENAKRPFDFNKSFYCEQLPQSVSEWEEFIVEDVSTNIDLYEMYGSVYLGAPNTEWRGRELLDRIDY